MMSWLNGGEVSFLGEEMTRLLAIWEQLVSGRRDINIGSMLSVLGVFLWGQKMNSVGAKDELGAFIFILVWFSLLASSIDKAAGKRLRCRCWVWTKRDARRCGGYGDYVSRRLIHKGHKPRYILQERRRLCEQPQQ